MSRNRDDGYYWVKEGSIWVIAKWRNLGEFWEVGPYDFLTDDDFDEIDERRLVRGE